jgi:hypothetical protein
MILIADIKAELRVDGTADDTRLTDLRDEAIYDLQQYSTLTLVETVTDATTERALTPLDKRYVYQYLHVHYDGRQDMEDAMNATLEKIRNL